MAHRHMKTCSTSLANREMQIKITLRHHFTPVRIAIINKSTKKVFEKMWRKGKPSALLVRMQLIQPLWKIVWNILKKFKIEVPLDPEIPLLGLYLKNLERPIQKNPCTAMFIAAQFTIDKCWKQPKCPSVNEWIKNSHLHNRIPPSRKKEGAPTLRNRRERCGEH